MGLSEQESSLLRPVSQAETERLTVAVDNYQRSVTPAVARWLAARGVDLQTALTFRLGVVPDDDPAYPRMAGMVSIPYLSAGGTVVGVRFRCIEQHEHLGHGKYMSNRGASPRLFNVAALVGGDGSIHVAEGEFDAMVLTSLGLPAVAVPGVATWAPRHRRMLAGFGSVYVWSDPDDAGDGMADAIIGGLRQAVRVPLRRADGDVTDLFVSGGADAVLHRLGEV